MARRINKAPFPESATITLLGDLKAKLYCENLSNDIVENIVSQIKRQDENDYTFKELVDKNANKPLQFYVYNNKASYTKHTGSDSKYGHYDHSLNIMHTYRDPNANNAFLYDARHIARAKSFLSNQDELKLNDNLKVILRYKELDNKELKSIKKEIKDTFDEYEDKFGIEDHGHKTITFFLYNNKKDYHDHGGAGQVGGCGGNKYCVNQVDVRDSTNILNAYRYIEGDDLLLRIQVSYALSHHNVDTGVRMLSEREEPLEDEIQDEGELDEEEVIDLSQYNLKVRIHYNDLSDDQLGAAEKEIKKTFSDFNKSFRLEKSNSPRELQLYIYDNRDDFTEHTGSDAAGIASPYWNGDNVAKMSIYKLDDDGVGFTEYLRHELAHGLTFYCNGSPGLTCGGKADYGLTSFLLEGIAYYIHEGSNLPGGSTFNPEDYYKDGHKLVSLLERCYPKVIDSIIHNNNLYKNALKHFKAEFPNLVSHISDDESFSVYDEAFFERIFENKNVRNEVAKLISAKPSKEAAQSYEDDDEEEEGGDYDEDYDDAGMQYEMKKDSLQITDSKTGDTVKMPKKFKYLKLEKDDKGEYKLVLCDKKGHALSDNKKYAKIDDKYKYINTKAVNLDEDIEFDDYDEEDLFFIQPDETNSQVVKILDVYEDEIGMLSNNDFI
ncbi:MAG: hypothetical protein U0X86_000083 [Wolbachia endosymbiont of Xenopsylla cheopis]